MTELAEHSTANGVHPIPASPEPAPADAPGGWDRPGSLLQRVILPNAGDPLDVRALYLDEDKGNFRRVRALSRTQVEFPATAGISFATYFNAFPASYWRHWTTLSAVELRLVLTGGARVDVYRSKADGTQMHVTGEVVHDDGDQQNRIVLTLDLAPFVDGGWYWFEITTDTDVVLHEAGWYAPVDAPGRASVAIGICTFNRPTDCTVALHTIGSDPLLQQAVNKVIVADQGNRKVRDEARYPEAAGLLGDKLRIVDQGNLGGSGGFSRVMYEALETTDCEQILLLDDDIVIEPDSILRAIAFSRFAERPMIVGGQMLNLTSRSHLHTMGEVVDRSTFSWRPAPHVTHDHDFAKFPLRDTKSVKLHRRIDVDYNGWWMCLIPRVVAEKAGLPLPLFIKWDDVEYGLRSASLGHPTATLPGVGIWHMPWSDKDDAVDWQAYFHLRNRLVVSALHGEQKRGGKMFLHSLKSTLKHLLSLQYSTVAVQQKAMADFEAGPLALFDSLPTALPDVNGVRSQYNDANVITSPRELPLPSMSMTKAERFLKPPANPITIGRSLVAGLVHNTRPAKPEHHEAPQLNLAFPDARWFMMSRLDGATVATADARGVAFRKRDPKLFRALLRESLRAHVRLARDWPKHRKAYRAALPELTGRSRWEKVFGIGSGS